MGVAEGSSIELNVTTWGNLPNIKKCSPQYSGSREKARQDAVGTIVRH